MTLCTLGILILWLLIPWAGWAAELRFRFHKDIDGKAAPGEDLLAAVLDPDVYEAAREGFPDLRIRDEAGIEVPYLVERAVEWQTKHDREACSSEVVSLRDRSGKALEIVVKLRDEALAADGLTVVTPLTDYEHRLKVFGSRGDQVWSPLVADGLIFDYTRYMDVRNRDVRLPPNDFRRFKLEIQQATDLRESPLQELARGLRQGRQEEQFERSLFERRPFRIDRIDLWRTVEKESVIRAMHAVYRAPLVQIEQDAEEKVTRINLRSRREPLTGFTLESPSRNFSRNVRVRVPLTRGVRTDWMEIGHGAVHRFGLKGFLKEGLTVGFAERRSESYQIVIESADNPPLEITSVHAEGNVYRLLFLARQGHRYRLDYGSDIARSPRYDTATVLDSLGPKYPQIEVRLGSQVENPGYRESTGLGKLLNSSAFLFLALAVMTMALAWLLLRAGKRIKKQPDPDV
jgi:hypothetical protein